jgi:hypothetical protein
MKDYVNKLHAQRSFCRKNSKTALCRAFYCVNDNKKVNIIILQIMHCILCHNNPILNLNPKPQTRKGLFIYKKTNGIIALRKHVNLNHHNVFLKIEKMNCPLKEKERQLLKETKYFF